MTMELLKIEQLTVAFGATDGAQTVVDEAGFSVAAGEKVALVGESGSGKSVTALSILKLHDPLLTRYSGAINVGCHNLLTLTEPQMRRIRGRDIAMVFQEPMTALNPLHSIGRQIAEPLILHEGLNAVTARKRTVELLMRVGIADAESRLDAYPHMLSGGQRQRAMIAMALALEPAVVIMDEPTTALDVVTQREILTGLAALQHQLSFAVLFITHDLSLLVELADSIAVMYAGRLIEQASATDLYRAPRHPYTLGLLHSFPPLHGARKPLTGIPGSPPDLRTPPPGCPFHPRCGFAMDLCRQQVPAAVPLGRAGERTAACWLQNGTHDVPAELAVPERGTGAGQQPVTGTGPVPGTGTGPEPPGPAPLTAAVPRGKDATAPDPTRTPQ